MIRLLESAALLLYRVIGVVVVPVVGLVLLPFMLLVRRRRATMLPRLGFQAWPAPGERPVWIHALSVGELLSAAHLIETLRTRLDGRRLVLSVSTLSGRELAEKRLAPHVDAMVFFPYDLVFATARAARVIDPALFVLIETDLWPGMQATLRRRGIPALLLNGRLSPPTFRFYRSMRLLFRPAINAFDGVYPQSADEADRFLALGLERDRLRRPGNLKFDAAGAPPRPEDVDTLRQRLGLAAGDPVLLAGSTHPGEETVVADAWRRLREDDPRLRLVLVPRRPERAREVADLFDDGDGVVRMLSRDADAWSVLVVDEIGHLARLYALADVAFVGGSLVPEGGHNPLEAAVCGKPILFGPDMEDFPDIARRLVDGGAAVQLGHGGEFHAQCRVLLSDTDRARAMGEAARRIVNENRGITEVIVEAILRMLEPAPRR